MMSAPRACIVLSLGFVLACGGKDPGGTATTTGDGGETTAASTGEPGQTGGSSTGGATTTGTTATGTTDVDPTTGGSGTTGEPGPLMCPEAIDQAILACVADLQSDPELAQGNFLLDLLLMCSDAEPVADDYDAHCAENPGDPICALDYWQFVDTVLPECIARAQGLLFADVCLLPATYDELLFAPALALMKRRHVFTAAELDAAEQEQLLRMTADLGIEVDSVTEALQAPDDQRIEQITLLDVGTDRVLVLYSEVYDGVRAGRMFFRDAWTVVGALDDNQFSRCGVELTMEGRRCADDLGCDDGFVCEGVLDGMDGACAPVDVLPGTGDACGAHDDCDPTSGLLCLDVLEGQGTGECRPGWMRHSFVGPTYTRLVAGGTTSLPIVVSGVSTFATTAYLDLVIVPELASEFQIDLVSPAGTSTPVPIEFGPNVFWQLEPVSVPSDEAAVGVWHLDIEELSGIDSGVAFNAALMLDTRPD